jgi:DNA-binding NarL/FixJ family response regulator
MYLNIILDMTIEPKKIVKSNLNRILSKLGAKDRTQATIIALKREIASL